MIIPSLLYLVRINSAKALHGIIFFLYFFFNSSSFFIPISLSILLAIIIIGLEISLRFFEKIFSSALSHSDIDFPSKLDFSMDLSISSFLIYNPDNL